MKTIVKTWIRLFIPVVMLFMLVISCTHYYYVANVQNVPLFRERNELHLSGAYSLGEESESIEVQSAYSISDNVGIMANFMSTKGGVIFDKDYGKGYYMEGGVGYYKPVGDFGVFEVYGGLGRSQQHHEYTSFRYDPNTGYYGTFNDGKSELSFTKLFIQPAFGVTGGFLDVALSARLNIVSFNNINKTITAYTEMHEELNSLSDKDHVFIEPAITVRGGWKYIKVQFQASYSKYLNSPRLYFGEETHLSIGLYFTITDRYKKNAAGTRF